MSELFPFLYKDKYFNHQLILHSMVDPIFVFNLELRLDFLNESALNLLDHSIDHLLGKTSLEIGLQETGVFSFWQQLVAVIKTGKPKYAFTFFINKIGKPSYYEACFSPLKDFANQLKGVVCVLRDPPSSFKIDEELALALEESEQRFKAAVDHFPNIFVIYDSNRRLVFINKMGLITLGQFKNNYFGKRDEDFFPSTITQLYLPTLLRVYNEKRSLSFEMRLSEEFGGKIFWVNYVPLLNRWGGIREVFGVSYEISQWRKTEEELRSRDSFISIASHELKNPLTSLILQLELIKKRVNHLFKSSDLREIDLLLSRSVDGAERQAKKMGALVGTLLDLTLIRLGRFELSFEKFDFTQLVRDEVLLWDAEAKSKNTQIQLSVDKQLFCYGDKKRISQVISNFISNAIKFGKGNPISIQVRESHESENKIEFIIEDHGEGIPQDFLNKIFDQFERGPIGQKFSGLGLGLYISRQIIEAHRGGVFVDSELGKGSRFKVQLPCT